MLSNRSAAQSNQKVAIIQSDTLMKAIGKPIALKYADLIEFQLEEYENKIKLLNDC